MLVACIQIELLDSPFCYSIIVCSFVAQVARNKSKKGGIQKRVYAWGGISWHAKTELHTWTAAEAKACIWRHTKRIMVCGYIDSLYMLLVVP